jgi:hypothetical protein
MVDTPSSDVISGGFSPSSSVTWSERKSGSPQALWGKAWAWVEGESAHLWVFGVVSVKGLVKAKGGFEVRAAGSGKADDEAVVKGLEVVVLVYVSGIDDFKNYRWCEESHIATGLQKQAFVHRRHGQNNREKLSKTQYKLKRKNQTIRGTSKAFSTST